MRRLASCLIGLGLAALALGMPATQAQQTGSTASAAMSQPLQATLAAQRAYRQAQWPLLEQQLSDLLRQHPEHLLKPYWVYLLAQFEPQRESLSRYLRPQDPLWPHYHWWRGMRQPKGTCSQDFAHFAQRSELSAVMPSVPESTEIQDRLSCVEKLPESQRLSVAKVLDQHRYFWLLPRVLKDMKSPEGLWLQAESHFLLRQYRPALNAYATLIQQQATAGELKKQAVIQAGLAERHLKNPAGAQKWWSWIASHDTRFYPEVLWQRAMLAFGSSRQGEGESLLTQLVQQHAQHERAPEALAYLLNQTLQRRDAAASERLALQLVRGWPEHEAVHRARYWLARSLERRGQAAEARRWYQLQSQGPLNQYYTQLALCRLQGVDCFLPRYIPLRAQAPQLAFLRPWPELYLLAEQQETQILETVAAFAPLSGLERQLLQSYALRYNGNYFRSIRTIWQHQTRDPDVLRLMYPLHYDALQKENAARYNLPQSLIAGLTWQESMYKADIKSPSGAMGLMQLMPATARGIASAAGLPGLNLNQLSDPAVNIRLGSYYLNEQLRRWNGNLLPMMSSYNAGPNATARWVQSFGAGLDKDEFVERIPYDETRRYVKQVLTHSRVYEAVYAE